ncbi:transmembrane protein 242 isoform X2 [Calliopsis andreniformis]|uniref:transmembrane protein 242 isoform X2 n=1 Tax=Calliopsis andreniformis TaxID=337506 RepID=UPI003FCC4CBE
MFNISSMAFMAGAAGIAVLAGFATAVGISKQEDVTNFEKGLSGAKDLPEPPLSLARRALIRGSLCALCGCGLWAYGLWKYVGSPSFKEFQEIVKNAGKPRSKENDFESISDFMQYISESSEKEK